MQTDYNLMRRYCRLLENWHRSSATYRHVPGNMPGTVCYGTGYNKWGVQTHQKAFAAAAVLASAPEFDERLAGQSRGDVLDCAIQMLRFSLQSHLEGSGSCLDGTQWGHTWISALGIERMMHGVDAIHSQLATADLALLRTVLLSECDWLVDHYDIVADLDAGTGRNKPESNLWNGALLHRTAMMYPDCPRSEAYREKGTRFLVNSISVPADAALKEKIDGQSVCDLHVGANFFPSYALNHHGYLNVGYMVICLSNAAMLHFSYRSRGIAAPPALYHHVQDLWRLIRRCTFDDGRLLRIGGDTRVRYCYCQDYAIPMWLLIEDHYGDPECSALESNWLSQVEKEVAYNRDGSFLRQRLTHLETSAPLYYTRLESDRAAALSMGLHWRQLMATAARNQSLKPATSVLGGWHDAFHGACLQRDPERIASWTWDAAERPQGLCVPPGRSDMAEWRYNLAGRIKGLGGWNYATITDHQESTFPGGFLTWGRLCIRSEQHIAEGQLDEVLAQEQIVFAALPDGHTVAVLQFAKADHRVYLSEIKGIGLHLPNDLFNGMKRTYHSSTGENVLEGCPGADEIIPINGPWVNIDNCLSVISLYGGEMEIMRPADRQIGLKSDQGLHKARGGGMLYADEICNSCRSGTWLSGEGDILLDTGFLVIAGIDASQTRARHDQPCEEMVPLNTEAGARAVLISGMDGEQYLLAANFGDTPCRIDVSKSLKNGAVDLASGEVVGPENGNWHALQCDSRSARLLLVQPKEEESK